MYDWSNDSGIVKCFDQVKGAGEGSKAFSDIFIIYKKQ